MMWAGRHDVISCCVDKTGGSFNPAIGIALPTFKDHHMGDIWVYVVGPFIGAPLAACLFSFWLLGEAADNGKGGCFLG